MAGRKPKPLVLSEDLAGAPEKPRTVANDVEASALWDFLCETLIAQRVLSPVDGPVLTALCSAYARLVRVREEMSTQELVLTNVRTGASKANPLLGIEAGAAGEVARYSSELGLTPTARARIQHLAEPEEDDGFDD